MRNYIQAGETLSVVCPAGGVASGTGVLIGALFGVAVGTAAEGEALQLLTEGVVELPKLATAQFTQGAPASWDNANKRCDVPAAGKYPIGVAVEPAGNGVSVVRVRLDGAATLAA